MRESQRALLIVLQGMDTSAQGRRSKHVDEGRQPLPGCSTFSFGQPRRARTSSYLQTLDQKTYFNANCMILGSLDELICPKILLLKVVIGFPCLRLFVRL